MAYHKGVPKEINGLLSARRVDAGFVSSIISPKFTHLNVGVVAYKKVLSVLVVQDDETVPDSQSQSSNALADILGVKGKILIGDKALRLYLKEKESPNFEKNVKDLATLWHQKYHLPFVFARFCVNAQASFYAELLERFVQRPIKIPHYILTQESQKHKIDREDIKAYLKYIHFKMGKKEEQSLRLFFRLLRQRRHRQQ